MTPLPINSTEPTTPEVAIQRSWVASRSCWCPDDAKDDCRYHSPDEKGWKVCPNKPSATSPIKPRKLWHQNPVTGSKLEDVV